MVLGLCGKYCSGKSEAARILQEDGWRVIDADSLGHEVLEERKAEVQAAFGDGILSPAGSVDRRKLGAIVFRNSAKLKTLEAIVHPRVREKIEESLASSQEPAVIHAALLFTGGLDKLCDRIIIITAPLLDRVKRGRARDKLGILAIFRRIAKQRKLIPQSSFLPADTITVKNSGTRGSLRTVIREAASRLS